MSIVNIIKAIIVSISSRRIIFDEISAIERSMAFDSKAAIDMALNSAIRRNLPFDSTAVMGMLFDSRIKRNISESEML